MQLHPLRLWRPRINAFNKSLRFLNTSNPRLDVQDNFQSSRQSAPRPSSAPSASSQRDSLSFWPFLLIFIAGSGAFAYIVKSREGVNVRPQSQSTEAIEGPLVKKKRNQESQRE